MLMKEFTANQIAAALVGHPGSAEQELRLLRLFQTDAGVQLKVEPGVKPELVRAPLAKAA
jgi:hypothetical protein